MTNDSSGQSKKTWYVLGEYGIFEEKIPPVHCPYCDDIMVETHDDIKYFWCINCNSSSTTIKKEET